MFCVDSGLRESSGIVRSSLITFLTKILGHILECGKKNVTDKNGGKGTTNTLNEPVSLIMKNLDDVISHLVTEVPWTLNSKIKSTNAANTPAVLGKRIADSLRSLYVRGNKNKIENFTTSGMSISEMKLQKSLNEIDQQVNEISLNQDTILKNANNKNLRCEEGDKEKAQLQRVFVMREMSLDKIQLMLDVSTHLFLSYIN